MTLKRNIVESLKRDELIHCINKFSLEVSDRRSRQRLIDALIRNRRINLGSILDDIPRIRLKELCRKFDLSDTGREKSVLVDRLIRKKPIIKKPEKLLQTKTSSESPGSTRAGSRQREDISMESETNFEAALTVNPISQQAKVKADRVPSSNNLANYIWSLADLLRGDFKQSQYGRIILPFTL